jgi:hypothetical protein
LSKKIFKYSISKHFLACNLEYLLTFSLLACKLDLTEPQLTSNKEESLLTFQRETRHMSRNGWGWGCSSIVEHLLSICEALHLITSISKIKQTNKQTKTELHDTQSSNYTTNELASLGEI